MKMAYTFFFTLSKHWQHFVYGHVSGPFLVNNLFTHSKKQQPNFIPCYNVRRISSNVFRIPFKQFICTLYLFSLLLWCKQMRDPSCSNLFEFFNVFLFIIVYADPNEMPTYREILETLYRTSSLIRAFTFCFRRHTWPLIVFLPVLGPTLTINFPLPNLFIHLETAINDTSECPLTFHVSFYIDFPDINRIRLYCSQDFV